MKKIMYVPLAVLLVSGCSGAVSSLSSTDSTSVSSSSLVEEGDVYVTMDINPSFGFMLNQAGEVEMVQALNGDAEMVMLNINEEGKTLALLLDEIVDEAVELDFIDEAEVTTIEVDALGPTATLQEQIRSQFQNQVNDAMSGNSLNVQVQTRSYTTDFEDDAEAAGLTPIQYRVALQAMQGDVDLTLEEAAELDVDGLLAKVKAGHTLMLQISASLQDDLLAAKDAVHAIYDPQILVVEEAIMAAEAASEDTTQLEADLVALQDQLHDELQDVMDDFIALSITTRASFQTIADAIKNGTYSGTGGTTSSN